MSFAKFLKALYRVLNFSNIFVNDIFLVVEKSDICNFAGDSTLFSHGSNIPLIMNNLEDDMKNHFIGLKLTPLRETQKSFSW